MTTIDGAFAHVARKTAEKLADAIGSLDEEDEEDLNKVGDILEEELYLIAKRWFVLGLAISVHHPEMVEIYRTQVKEETPEFFAATEKLASKSFVVRDKKVSYDA